MDFTNFWFPKKTGASGDPGDPINQSLRFRDATSWLRKNDFATTPSSTFTMSMWVKLPTTTTANFRYLYGFGNQALINQVSQLRVYQGTGSAVQIGTALYRDPSAWYHICVNNTPGTYNLWVNGELQGTINRTVTPANDIRIGDWASQSNNSSISITIADVYWIEDQVLEPTVFGRYNEFDVWVPVNPQLDSTGVRYSDYLTTTGSFTRPAENAFNGQLDSSGLITKSALATGNLTFAPVPSIPVTDLLRVSTAQGGGTAEWNGLTVPLSNDGQDWKSFGQGNTGEISVNTPLVIQTASGNATLCAVEVDGEVLLNPFLWSAQLYTSTNSSLDVNSTDKNFPAGGEATFSFDGATNSGAFPSGSDTALVFRPNSAITGVTSLRIYSAGNMNSGSFAGYNGTNIITNPTNGWHTLYSGSATIVNNVYITSTGSASFSAIEVNGQILVDGVNSSYGANGFHLDFADPNDLGADRSGNGNDFTTTGFNTQVPGIWSNDLQGGTISTYQPDEADRTATVGDRTGGFDGNLGSTAYVSTTHFIYFVPSTPITGITSLFYRTSGTVGETRVNGNVVSVDASTGSTRWVEVQNPPGTLEELAFNCTNGFTSIYAVGVNGTATENILIDNTGTDYDLMQDSPTQNWATINPLRTLQNLSCAPYTQNANLRHSNTSTNTTLAYGPTIQFPEQDQVFFGLQNVQTTSWGSYIGLYKDINRDQPNSEADDLTGINWDGVKWVQVINGAYGSNVTFDVGDWLYFAYDRTNTRARVWVNDTLVIDNTSAPNDYRCFYNVPYNLRIYNYNFGQIPYAHNVDPFNGAGNLQTANMPAATIANGRDHFQAITGGNLLPTPASETVTKIRLPVAGGTLNSFAITGQNAAAPRLYGVEINGVLLTDASHADGDQLQSSTNAFTSATYPTNWTTYAGDVGPRAGAFNGVLDPPTNPNSYCQSATYWTRWQPTSPIADVQELVIYVAYAGGGTGAWVNEVNVAPSSILDLAQQTFPNGLWWIKDRANNSNHQLLDSVRGGLLTLQPNTAQAEQAYSAPSGVSVAWCWKAGESSVTDNTGTIESQVCVNEEAGFSIVQWVGSGGFDSIGHGLGKRPGMVITRTREADHWIVGIDGVTELSSGGSPSQWVNNESFVGSNWANGLILNSSNAATNYVASSGINKSGENMIAYVWAPIPGYSAFGSYTGNGDADGPFIYTGFRPAFLLLKSSTLSNGWMLMNSTTGPINPITNWFNPNETTNEQSAASPAVDIDFLSNGFKIRNIDNAINQTGQSYVYACFAENPFNSPVTAR